MKVTHSLIQTFFVVCYAQDPETTQPSETTATTTATKTETTPAVIKCFECSATMLNDELTDGDKDCFDNPSNVGTADQGTSGFCSVTATYNDDNGNVTKSIVRGGGKQAGDVEKYPRETYSSEDMSVCNTGTLCNDKDGTEYFYPSSFQIRSNRFSDEFSIENSPVEPSRTDLADDDKTTTKATTTTTTVAPSFSCYMCDANANGNATALGACLNPAANDATLDVCGDGIGSCKLLFRIDGDSATDTEQYTIERACNDADQPNDDKIRKTKHKTVTCIQSGCNDALYDLSNTSSIFLSACILLLSLFL